MKENELEFLKRHKRIELAGHNALMGEYNSRLHELERQIADAEVTYSIGDRFNYGDSKYILVSVGNEFVDMINLGTGDRFNSKTHVRECYKITEKEIKGPFSCMVRYWDSQKKQKL